jgi:hypothetical protein
MAPERRARAELYTPGQREPADRKPKACDYG